VTSVQIGKLHKVVDDSIWAWKFDKDDPEHMADIMDVVRRNGIVMAEYRAGEYRLPAQTIILPWKTQSFTHRYEPEYTIVMVYFLWEEQNYVLFINKQPVNPISGQRSYIRIQEI